MVKDEYSNFKFVHHLDKIQQMKNGLQPVPIQIHMVPSNVCNQRCVFCAYRMKDYLSNETFDETQMLSYDKIQETITSFALMGGRAIQYTGGGEPLTHPKIKQIFRDTFDATLDLALVSNGMALDEEMCEMLGYASWTRISVDCGTAKTYSFLRNVKGSNFDKVINNIKMLVKYKLTNIVGIGFVIEKENYKEVYQAAKIFKDLGVDNFRISAAFTPFGYSYFNDFMDEAKDLCQVAQGLTDEKFTVFNLFNDRIRDNFIGVQDYDNCPIKDLQVYVGADYNVYTCCTLAYNQRGLIGSIKDHTFQSLWMSKKKTEMYKNHNPRVLCQHPCMYYNKNEFINYTIKKDARHVNFI